MKYAEWCIYVIFYLGQNKRAKPFCNNPIVDNDVVVDSFYVPQNEDFNNLSGIVLALSGEYFEPTAAISFISKKEDISKVKILTER